MNSYFFNITNEERSNILDKHKEIYDGYVTQYGKGNNQEPIYIQDLANDKDGITVNNKGDVGVYRNININEMRHDGKDTGLFSGEATEDVLSGSQGFEPEETFEGLEDTIGDGPTDLEHGTVEFDDDENMFDEIDLDDIDELQEQLYKTHNMFKRFNKY